MRLPRLQTFSKLFSFSDSCQAVLLANQVIKVLLQAQYAEDICKYYSKMLQNIKNHITTHPLQHYLTLMV